MQSEEDIVILTNEITVNSINKYFFYEGNS